MSQPDASAAHAAEIEAVDFSDFSSYAHEVLWQILALQLPDWYVHPAYRLKYPTKDVFAEKFSSIPVTFADGLLDMVRASSPPSLDEIKELAIPDEDHRNTWAVYLHVYELEGRKPRIYIGSGTNADGGIRVRMLHYQNEEKSLLPRHVARALAQGFTKTHTTYLCWCPKPGPGLVPTTRLTMLAFEGLFQFLFFAAFRSVMDPFWLSLMPWSRDDVSWEPLCGHVAFRERGPEAPDLPPEELEIIAKNRAARKRELDREWNKAYLRRTRNRWSEWNKEYHRKIKESRAIVCEACDIVFRQNNHKKVHLKTPRHLRNVAIIANGGVVAPSKLAIKSKKYRDKNKALKRFPCWTCVHFFCTRNVLKDHLKTNRHATAAAAADAAIEAPIDEIAVDVSDYDDEDGSGYLSEMDLDILEDLGHELGDPLLIDNGDSDDGESDSEDEAENAIPDTVDSEAASGKAFSDAVHSEAEPDPESDSEPVCPPTRRAAKGKGKAKVVEPDSDSDSEPVRPPNFRRAAKAKAKAKAKTKSKSKYQDESDFVVSDSHVSFEESAGEDLE